MILTWIGLTTAMGCTAPDEPDAQGDGPGAPAPATAPVGAAFLAGSENELPRCSNCEVSLAVSGMSSFGSAANSSNEQLSPNATLVGRDLSVAIGVAPGTGTRQFFLSVLPPSSESSLTCSITGTATTCNSGAQTMTIPPGSRLKMFAINKGDAPASNVRFGWRAVTP